MSVKVSIDSGKIRIDHFHQEAIQEAIANVFNQSDVMMDCPHCDGMGEVECADCVGHGTEDCPDCLGDGCEWCDEGEVDCDTCGGGGWDDCEYCEGNGQRPVQWVNVEVVVHQAGSDVEGAE